MVCGDWNIVTVIARAVREAGGKLTYAGTRSLHNTTKK